jgi:hypothetical protein
VGEELMVLPGPPQLRTGQLAGLSPARLAQAVACELSDQLSGRVETREDGRTLRTGSLGPRTD